MPRALGTCFSWHWQNCASFKKPNEQRPESYRPHGHSMPPARPLDLPPEPCRGLPSLEWHTCPLARPETCSHQRLLPLACRTPDRSLRSLSSPSTSLCPQCHLPAQAALSPPPQFICLPPSGCLYTHLCPTLLCCPPHSVQTSDSFSVPRGSVPGL